MSIPKRDGSTAHVEQNKFTPASEGSKPPMGALPSKKIKACCVFDPHGVAVSVLLYNYILQLAIVCHSSKPSLISETRM